MNTTVERGRDGKGGGGGGGGGGVSDRKEWGKGGGRERGEGDWTQHHATLSEVPWYIYVKKATVTGFDLSLPFSKPSVVT